MKKFLFLISLLFCSLMTEAQSLISGRLFDGSNNEPLIGATVLVVGTNTGSLTDVNGEYIINIDPGTYDLRYSFISYKTTDRKRVV
jgi:hypothetical protein